MVAPPDTHGPRPHAFPAERGRVKVGAFDGAAGQLPVTWTQYVA
jgi:hypothetical protein